MTVFRVRQVYRFTLKNSSLLSVPFDWRIQAELVPGTLGDGDPIKEWTILSGPKLTPTGSVCIKK